MQSLQPLFEVRRLRTAYARSTAWARYTASGLNRVDIEQVPTHFTIYLPDASNPQSISHHDISDMFEDQQGNFWVSTQGRGLNFYHRKSNSYIAFSNQVPNVPRARDTYPY